MRIALTCPYALDDPGGVQTHVSEQADHLRARGHEVVVLAPIRGPDAGPGVRAVGRPVDIPYNASKAPIDPRPWSIRRVGAELATFGPEIVHVHEPLTPSTSMWATFAAKAPVLATFHSGAERSRLYDLAAPLLRAFARRISIRIAVSEAAAGFARRRIGGRFEIVPNGTDVERFAAARPADLGPGTKLLFVGRLDERKGFPVAVAAFERLAADRPDLHLVVIGDGPDRAAVSRLSADARGRVHLLGAIPNVDLPPFHAACDLYLGTAVGGESFGMVLVEAMAAGLPVVASKIAGYTEVVREGVDGLLVPAKDPAAVAGAVARVLDDPNLAQKLRTAGLDRARSFDWEGVIAQLERLYARAARRPPTPIP